MILVAGGILTVHCASLNMEEEEGEDDQNSSEF